MIVSAVSLSLQLTSDLSRVCPRLSLWDRFQPPTTLIRISRREYSRVCETIKIQTEFCVAGFRDHSVLLKLH